MQEEQGQPMAGSPSTLSRHTKKLVFYKPGGQPSSETECLSPQLLEQRQTTPSIQAAQPTAAVTAARVA